MSQPGIRCYPITLSTLLKSLAAMNGKVVIVEGIPADIKIIGFNVDTALPHTINIFAESYTFDAQSEALIPVREQIIIRTEDAPSEVKSDDR